jgi:hypothetical protein
VDLAEQHILIMELIGLAGAEPDRLRSSGREFTELEQADFIVFWRQGGVRPESIFGGGTVSGRWYLTFAGAEKLGLEMPPLRFG